MALPATVDQVFVEGDTWTAATVNALQNAIVDNHEKLRGLGNGGSGWRHMLGPRMMFRDFTDGYSYDATRDFLVSAGSLDRVYGMFPGRVGMRLTAWEISGRDDGVANFTGKLFRVDMNDGVAVQIGSTVNSASSGADETIVNSAGLGSSAVLSATQYFVLEFVSGASADRVYSMGFTWDHPTQVQ